MTRTWKDAIATALVASVLILYVGFVALGRMPLVEDARGMAATGLLLCLASRRVGGRYGFRHERSAVAGNLASLILGVAALATESAVLLALFVASAVALWVAAYMTSDDINGGLHAAR